MCGNTSSAEFIEAMKRVTIRDVAREAGVSVTLVSFVMNAKRGEDGKLDCPVNQDTAKRVLEVARRLGFRRNLSAASLRSGKSNTIAVIPNDISNKFFAGISRNIEEEAIKYGYTVFFASSEENADRLSDVMDAVLAHNVDGIIVAPCTGGEAAIRKALDAMVPVVLLDRDMDLGTEESVGKVLLNDVMAGRMATQQMIDAGCRNIEMISYSLGISSLAQREKGYRETMESNGLADRVNVYYTDYGKVGDVEQFIKDALSRGADGLFLPTYSLSAQVLSAMKNLGLRTPEDLAIVGFDESDIYSLFATTITHIVQPLKALGEKSVDVLVSMIQGKGAESIVLNPELVPGGSTHAK